MTESPPAPSLPECEDVGYLIAMLSDDKIWSGFHGNIDIRHKAVNALRSLHSSLAQMRATIAQTGNVIAKVHAERNEAYEKADALQAKLEAADDLWKLDGEKIASLQAKLEAAERKKATALDTVFILEKRNTLLQAEIERLRGSLKQIISVCGGHPYCGTAYHIARDALRGSKLVQEKE